MEDKIIDFLKNKYNPIAIYLFGSYSKGNMTYDSDIDISILLNNITVNASNLFDSAQELAAIIGYDVDLINYLTAPLALKIQILQNKRVIYCNDNEKRLFNEMITLSLYQKLNEERALILENEFGANVWKLF
ncbi:MAG: nucleotidyltransferase domain-containing protein [Oligoflexia bacterium]|nr:nucleotidyltransferase domain-containing protein [Oligoflexia bacterium]